jgi:PAS domain S-box-containing protein
MDNTTNGLERDTKPTLALHGKSGPAGEDHLAPVVEMLRAQDMMLTRERQFRNLLDALPAAIYKTDADGRITYFNEAAAALWGHRPTIGSSEWCGSWKLRWPDGTPMAHDACPMAVALKEGRPIRNAEAAAERPDGTCVPFLASPTPLYDETGRLTGAVNMLVDISERKRAEADQAVLIRELHHRVKNTLATVQAIMGSTARTASTIDDFKTALTGRIASLAKTHLLLSDEGGSVVFGDILRKELEAFDDGRDGRIRLNGPDVDLSPQLAVTLGMAVHELTTNAARHGALSVHGGNVDVAWRVSTDSGRRTLAIDWVESNGPAVTGPARRGFGSRLLEAVLPGQIQARTRVDYPADGVRVYCAVPLPADALA